MIILVQIITNSLLPVSEYTGRNFFNRLNEELSEKLKDILIPAVEKGLVMGELHKGIWEDIGTNERLEDAKSKYERKGGKALD